MHTNNEEPGAYTGFFKEKQWAADSCTGRERGDINPPMGAHRKGGGGGGAAQKASPQGQKRPLHRDKSCKKTPA